MKAAMISIYGVGVIILGALSWGFANIAPKAEFEQHVAESRCIRATDRWIVAANNLDKRPEDRGLKKEEREARVQRDQQCAKKG